MARKKRKERKKPNRCLTRRNRGRKKIGSNNRARRRTSGHKKTSRRGMKMKKRRINRLKRAKRVKMKKRRMKEQREPYSLVQGKSSGITPKAICREIAETSGVCMMKNRNSSSCSATNQTATRKYLRISATTMKKC